MKKLLIAITAHNSKHSAVWKSWRSTRVADGADTVLFCHDRKPDVPAPCVLTGEETLGGKRNAAIQYARANGYKLVAFLDDDDLFGPSWVKALLELEPQPRTIYHPHWNVMFGPNVYKVHEHLSSSDPRFDSRDFLNFNLWSALCAFDPMTVDVRYRKHVKTDKRESFEDWSFNLDTYCDGYEHVALPDTFHFLRIRQNSLGKDTRTCGPAHTRFFLDSSLRDKKHATKEHHEDESEAVKESVIQAEFRAIHEIEPQLYFWGQTIERDGQTYHFEQEQYGRVGVVSDAITGIGISARTADVFWTMDMGRTGGAEKALSFAQRFLARFPLGAAPEQRTINDLAVPRASEINPGTWCAALSSVLKAWQDAPGSEARSLHICNTPLGWSTICRNPDLFDKVQVYFYVFNDDLRFESDEMDPETKGFHSPLYRWCEMIDRPNFHIITDSQHFAQRIHEKTGLGERVRIIDIPVVQQECKRKPEHGSMKSILWAGRFDHGKGLELLCDVAILLPEVHFHVWGAGECRRLDQSSSNIHMHGKYKSFEYITGKYDFMWFTSEREGMPNVVKEALSAGIPVLARAEDWCDELPGLASYPKYWDAEKIADLIRKFDPASFVPKQKFDFENAIPRAMFAFKEALV
jgi:glycosyltransferase involved in cell wall biosynthesis